MAMYGEDIAEFLESLKIWRSIFALDKFELGFDRLKLFLDESVFTLPFMGFLDLAF